MTDLLRRSLEKAFINHTTVGSHYDPKLIINDAKEKQYMLSDLHDELTTCDSFFFSVAFITQDGLAGLKAQLSDLNKRGVTGRLLTSVYLAFNQPDVFKDLLNIPNLKVRLSKKEGFHSKGYLFKQSDYYSLIIGSSNLTMSALKTNYEWNIRLSSHSHGQLLHDVKDHMESEWHEADPLTHEWIADYQKNYRPMIRLKESDYAKSDELVENSPTYITPNSMQKEALKRLSDLRETGAERGLIISATGTGKTFLSAFDVMQAEPERVLFIVHREQILNKAKADYQRILGGHDEGYGIVSGNKKEVNAKYVFATIQSLSRPYVLNQFDTTEFDYILVDEVHKAGAQSYLTVLDYFRPEFLLGMTATPERTDNFNIFELFDYNIAYEIRLQEALEEDMLCPFHYFGVTDYELNGELISETTDLNQLVDEERVDYLLDKLNYYGCSGNVPKGLIFCSRKEEAKRLAKLFDSRGVKSTYLSGEDSLDKRETEVTRLENGSINYIFTVDIFNEGIDIPKINQVVMLRSTQSNIIFVQQLGRGLRKDPSKDFVTVIDFIGNYKNNYMIPMALSGDVSRNKNRLRKDTYDTDYISGLSTINFEEIAKEQVFSSINNAKLDSMGEIKRAFDVLSNRLGRVPYLKDYQEQQTMDPFIMANKKKTYYDLLVSLKKNEGSISEEDSPYLLFASREFLPGMRKHELLVLNWLIANHGVSLAIDDIKSLFENNHLLTDDDTLSSVLKTLDASFYRGSQAKLYGNHPFIEVKGEEIRVSAAFQRALTNDYFVYLLKDILETGLLKSSGFDHQKPLTRYQKYKRKDVVRLLGWKEQLIDQNIGGYTAADGEFVIFVTLEKGEDFAGAQMAYEDELLDASTMKWFTKAPRTLESPEVKKLQEADKWTIRVFAKKSDDEGSDFYYLGEVKPIADTIQQVEKPIKDGTTRSVVDMHLKFAQPIETTLYRYLSTSK